MSDILEYVATNPGATKTEIVLNTRCTQANVDAAHAEVLIYERPMGVGQPLGYYITEKGLDALGF